MESEKINYNDGNWHGWQGGECPVHEKSIVSVLLEDNTVSKMDRAGNWVWTRNGRLGDIAAFRVEKECKEPKELWVYGDCDKNLATLEKRPSKHWRYVYKVVEVIDEPT